MTRILRTLYSTYWKGKFDCPNIKWARIYIHRVPKRLRWIITSDSHERSLYVPYDVVGDQIQLTCELYSVIGKNFERTFPALYTSSHQQNMSRFSFVQFWRGRHRKTIQHACTMHMLLKYRIYSSRRIFEYKIVTNIKYADWVYKII